MRAANIGNHTGSYVYQVSKDYFPETGQVDYITVSNGSTTLQSLTHTYDEFGNLDWRSTTIGGGATETLYYDELQRLTTSIRNYMSGGGDTVNYTFDASGTFATKSDYNAVPATDISATYVKHTYRPHVVTQLNLSSGGPVVYNHDSNGNVTQSDGETITYNAFNKPQRIDAIVGNDFAEFTYGADLMRYRQEKDTGAITYYLDKHMEIESLGTAVDYRHYLGDVAVLTKTGSLNDPNPGIDYVFRDRLGSVSAVGNYLTALLFENRAYDPYGRPRNGNWTDKTPEPIIGSNVTDRGFTDHEHLDDWQLIHMNGRGFDYNAGRFLSVDPFIQEPGNSQSINGFSYILNNPLSGTDPTGYYSMMVSVSYYKRTSSSYFGGISNRNVAALKQRKRELLNDESKVDMEGGSGALNGQSGLGQGGVNTTNGNGDEYEEFEANANRISGTNQNGSSDSPPGASANAPTTSESCIPDCLNPDIAYLNGAILLNYRPTGRDDGYFQSRRTFGTADDALDAALRSLMLPEREINRLKKGEYITTVDEVSGGWVFRRPVFEAHNGQVKARASIRPYRSTRYVVHTHPSGYELGPSTGPREDYDALGNINQDFSLSIWGVMLNSQNTAMKFTEIRVLRPSGDRFDRYRHSWTFRQY